MKNLFNVVFYDGSELPDDKILYIVTKKGNFLRKDLGTIRSCTQVDSISFLKEIEPYAELKIPQIPGRILAIGLGFLKWVYCKYKTEGGLIIYYNSQTQEYQIYAPTQEVSGGGVSWDNQKESIPKGFIRMGTIHSHGNMSAFHSGIDIDDEKSFDGLHITVGNLGEKIPSLVASVVANGSRFPVKKEQIQRYLDIVVIEDNADKKNEKKTDQSTQSPIYEDYQAWLDSRSRKVVKPPNWKNWKNTTYKIYMGKNEMRFVISVEPINFIFPNDWKSRVKEQQFTAGVYRIINGKLIPSNGSKQTGFVSNGNYDLLSDEELLNDYYGYSADNGTPFGGHEKGKSPYLPSDYILDDNDLSKLPHMTCIECMYRIIAEEALDRGLIDVEDDSDHDDSDNINSNDAISDDCPTGPTEEDYESYYGKHTEPEEKCEDVSFDEKGNIIDKNGIIIQKLEKDNKDL